jgi:Spy/CpxP family protein refolding chaperone
MVVPSAGWAQMEADDSMGMEMMGGGRMGGGGMGMQGMMGMHPTDDAGMGRMKMMMAMAARLNLTPDQKKKIERLHLQHQKEAIALLSRMKTAGVEIQELLLSDAPEMDKVKAKVKEKHQAQADLEVGHHVLVQQIKGLLTPEQRQKLESMPMGMPETGMKRPMMPMPGSSPPEPSER